MLDGVVVVEVRMLIGLYHNVTFTAYLPEKDRSFWWCSPLGYFFSLIPLGIVYYWRGAQSSQASESNIGVHNASYI
jgi:hypothetical protein